MAIIEVKIYKYILKEIRSKHKLIIRWRHFTLSCQKVNVRKIKRIDN